MRVVDVVFRASINGWSVFGTQVKLYAFKDDMMLIFESYAEMEQTLKGEEE